MRTVTLKILNVIVVILSVFYAGIAILFIYVSFNPRIFMGISTSLTGDIIRGVVGLILFGSTIYYFKSGQLIMKIISTIGCISILIIFRFLT